MDLGGLKSEVKATITLFREQSDGSEGQDGFYTLESEGQTAALLSPDDALEPVNERDCDVVAHSPGTTCSPPTPPFSPSNPTITSLSPFVLFKI